MDSGKGGDDGLETGRCRGGDYMGCGRSDSARYEVPDFGIEKSKIARLDCFCDGFTKIDSFCVSTHIRGHAITVP